MLEKSYLLKNQAETEALGLEIAKELKPGDIVALIGDLGAGKTTLAKAIARGLGVQGMLTSPTFTIVQEYDDGRLPLYHFDVYRVNDEEELFEIGFEDYLHSNGVCLIEWADLIADILPARTKTVRIGYGENENERSCEIEW